MCPAVAYEMLVSHSPPVFSHSPPSNGSFLSDYNPFLARKGRNSCRSSTTTFTPFKQYNNPVSSPKRPCLVIRPADESSSGSSDEDPTSPTKLKKKVVFADDKGMSLTHVRFMTEPSNVPPFWSFHFLAQVTQGAIEPVEPHANNESWEVIFQQPASDYLTFRKKLDIDKVSLENVFVKEMDKMIVGTIKVNNISYQKQVFVRLSCDNWKTSEDAYCTYVVNALMSSTTYVLYDTFSFKIPIPPKAKRIEFCVCFKCNGTEYWDNNGSKNYVLLKKLQPMPKSYSCNDIYKKRNETENKVTKKCADIVQAKLDSWSEFASWTHLENSNPYW